MYCASLALLREASRGGYAQPMTYSYSLCEVTSEGDGVSRGFLVYQLQL